MPELSRKQFLISADNAEKLSSLASAHSLSEGEIVRRAIEAYDPNDEHEKEAEAMFARMESVLKDAFEAVEQANSRVERLLDQLSSDSTSQKVVTDTLEEVEQHPGWLDELRVMLERGEAM